MMGWLKPLTRPASTTPRTATGADPTRVEICIFRFFIVFLSRQVTGICVLLFVCRIFYFRHRAPAAKTLGVKRHFMRQGWFPLFSRVIVPGDRRRAGDAQFKIRNRPAARSVFFTFALRSLQARDDRLHVAEILQIRAWRGWRNVAVELFRRLPMMGL